LKGYYVVLLRHNVKRRKLVILRKSSRLSRLAGSVVEYVIEEEKYSILKYIV
jgi:hypothetical protein